MKLKSIFMVTCCALLVLTVGCGKEDAATVARKERVENLLAEARQAEARGDVTSADALYRQLLNIDPTEARAHLSLANLSQDMRKNYLDAIYHYQRFLDLQPNAEKASMVKDRLTSARTLLANQLASEIIAREQAAITAERDALQAQTIQLGKDVRALKTTVEKRDSEIAELRGEIKRLNRLVEQLKTVETEVRAAKAVELEAARQAIEAAQADATEDASDDAVNAARAEAEMILNAVDGGVGQRDEALRAIAEGAKENAPIAAVPTPGKRYVVRPGDTFSALAREAYGSAGVWQRIREANRSTANPDGRLYAGQEVYIP